MATALIGLPLLAFASTLIASSVMVHASLAPVDSIPDGDFHRPARVFTSASASAATGGWQLLRRPPEIGDVPAVQVPQKVQDSELGAVFGIEADAAELISPAMDVPRQAQVIALELRSEVQDSLIN